MTTPIVAPEPTHDALEYEALHDADIGYVLSKINAMAREGWRVHTLTTVAVPESAHAHPLTIAHTALLVRPLPPPKEPTRP